MRITNQNNLNSSSNTKNIDKDYSGEHFFDPTKDKKSSINPQDKVEVRFKKIDHLKVGDNNPDRPLVSTKIIDSLNSGMIKFDQKERDVIAKILESRAEGIRKNKMI